MSLGTVSLAAILIGGLPRSLTVAQRRCQCLVEVRGVGFSKLLGVPKFERVSIAIILKVMV